MHQTIHIALRQGNINIIMQQMNKEYLCYGSQQSLFINILDIFIFRHFCLLHFPFQYLFFWRFAICSIDTLVKIT